MALTMHDWAWLGCLLLRMVNFPTWKKYLLSVWLSTMHDWACLKNISIDCSYIQINIPIWTMMPLRDHNQSQELILLSAFCVRSCLAPLWNSWQLLWSIWVFPQLLSYKQNPAVLESTCLWNHCFPPTSSSIVNQDEQQLWVWSVPG